MSELAAELILILIHTKITLYPAISKCVELNESCKSAEHMICQAYDLLQQAQQEIAARCKT